MGGENRVNEEPDAYQTYLLRLWRAQVKGQWQWRASLQCPRTGERQSFPNLERFFIFLRDRCPRQKPDVGEVKQ